MAEAAALEYQTKRLLCVLTSYTISEEGVLMDDEGAPTHHNGAVQFYGSNLLSYYPQYTANGEDGLRVTYEALFQDGRIVEIKQTECSLAPALPVSERPPFHFDPPLSEEEKKARMALRQESLIGKSLCVWSRGETSEPKLAEVVAEDDREIVVRFLNPEYKNDSHFEALWRRDRDDSFFDSIEEGKTLREKRLPRVPRTPGA